MVNTSTEDFLSLSLSLLQNPARQRTEVLKIQQEDRKIAMAASQTRSLTSTSSVSGAGRARHRSRRIMATLRREKSTLRFRRGFRRGKWRCTAGAEEEVRRFLPREGSREEDEDEDRLEKDGGAMRHKARDRGSIHGRVRASDIRGEHWWDRSRSAVEVAPIARKEGIHGDGRRGVGKTGMVAMRGAVARVTAAAGAAFAGVFLVSPGIASAAGLDMGGASSSSSSAASAGTSWRPNEVGSVAFVTGGRGSGDADLSRVGRFAPPSGAKFIFPDGTWTNQDYKATVRDRLKGGTTFTEMTPLGRSREPKTTKDHRQNPGYWGISHDKRLDELGANRTMLERPRTDGANLNGITGGKRRDARSWFLLDEEGRKWDMRIVNPFLRNPATILNMSYSDFWGLLQEGHIEKVKYTADRNHLWVWTKPDSPRGVSLHKIGLPYDPQLYDELIRNDVHVDAVVRSPAVAAIFSLCVLGYPAFALYAIYRVVLISGENSWEPFGEADHDQSLWGGSKFRMKDIGGLEDILPEVDEVVDYLRYPNRYTDLGAEPPSGVLLTGPPGCGKTLLAQCIAGEARTPLISLNSTSFKGMVQGSGTSLIRHTFMTARRIAPCVVFIDELDGIGTRRVDAFDERTQTINQMLTELDGFERNHGVVLIAATNRPGAIDEALMRPGRMDKTIRMPPPKLQGRIDILKIHSRGKRLAKDFDFELVGRATSGFTGAELKKLMDASSNEVIKRMRRVIETEDCLREVAKSEEVTSWQSATPGYFASFSPAAKIRAMSDTFKKSCAVYEAGKVLITYMLEDFDEVNKTVLFPQGNGVTKTFFLPQQQYMDTGTYTRRYVENLLIMHMSGLAAQELVLGRHNLVEYPTLRDDLKAANIVARQMVLRMGFNKRVGPVSMMTSRPSLRGKELSVEALDTAITDMSPEMGALVAAEVQQLIDAAQAKAYYGIIKNYKAMCRLAKALQVKRKMSGKAMKEVLDESEFTTFAENDDGDVATGETRSASIVDGFGFYDDNRLKVPLDDPALQRIIDGVVRGRRLGILEDPATMMADLTQTDATKDLTAWLLAGGRKVDLVDMAKPLDPWLDGPMSDTPLTSTLPESVRAALGFGPPVAAGSSQPVREDDTGVEADTS